MAADNDVLAGGKSSGQGEQSEKKEEKTEKQNYLDTVAPGALIGTDWSKSPDLDLKPSHISAVKSLLKKVKMRDQPARREEILRVWEAELFWRGYQHLLPARTGFGWEFAGVGSGYGAGEQNNQSIFDTNFYLIYGMSVVNALTRKAPKVRFEAVCPTNDADITAACAANKLIDLINRNNKMLSLMHEMARFLYTDGRCSFYTRYVKDGQRFGFGKLDEPENPEEASEEEAGTAPKPKKPKGGDPRGMVVTTVHGALEVKYPVKANSQSECGYLVWAREVDVSVGKGMYPKKADKIIPSIGGSDDIDRLARVNVRLGVEDNFVTSDSQQYDTTIESVWFRDCTLLEIDDEQTRDELLEMSAGKGLRFTFCGGNNEFLEAKQESMDDHWVLCHALPGDGMHRPGLGSPYIPIQKQVNTLYELRQDYLIRGIPMKFLDSDMFDTENLAKQPQLPGAFRPITADPIRPVSDFMGVEPTLQYPTGLDAAIDDMGKGQTAQLMTGVFPALSGDDAGQVSETMGGLAMQRDAALGRIGITWRYVKEAIACVTMQSVQCLALNHDEDIYTSGSKNGAAPILVELQDLKGKYICEPSVDDNYPQSYTEEQHRVEDLYQAAGANPELGDIVDHPNNYKLFKKATGLTELYVPKEESMEKQLGEIEDLKKSGPQENPEFAPLQQKIQALQAQPPMPDPATGQPVPNPQLAALQQQLQNTPEFLPSVQVDPDVDDNPTEADVCLAFLRSPAGRALKNGTTNSGKEGEPSEQAQYENIKLHFLAHKKLADQAKQNATTNQRAVSKSVNLKDLLAAGKNDEANQLLEEANIHPAKGAPQQ